MPVERDLSSQIALRLKTLRTEKELTIDALKDLIIRHGGTISRDSLINYETVSKHNSKYSKNLGMRIETLRVLAQIYGVSADYILALTDVRSPDATIKAAMDITGLTENNVRFLHTLNNTSKNESEENTAVISNKDRTIAYIKAISCATPAVGRTGISLINKVVHTIATRIQDVLSIYNTIEVSSNQLAIHQSKNVSPEKLIPSEHLGTLYLNGFQVVGASWIKNKSWEQLLNILQSGVEREIMEDISNGQSYQQFSINLPVGKARHINIDETLLRSTEGKGDKWIRITPEETVTSQAKVKIPKHTVTVKRKKREP